MNAQVIALTAPCRQCRLTGRVMDIGPDGSFLGVFNCPLCHGTGHAVRDCVWELARRIRLGERKRPAVQREMGGQYVLTGSRRAKSETHVCHVVKIDCGGRKPGAAASSVGGEQ